MAPRARKVSGETGKVQFYKGITDQMLTDFFMKNGLEKKSDSVEELDGVVVVNVPKTEETYVVPDDIYVWLKN